MIVETEDKEIIHDNHELKTKIKNTEQKIRGTLLYLKAFTDIINSIEFTSENNTNNQNIQIENEEEEIEIDENNSNLSDENKTMIEKKVSEVIKIIFENSNFEPFFKMLNNHFLSNLIKFFSNLTIEEFLINDFDKMIVIKELLYELEFSTLSLINNLIRNFKGLFSIININKIRF
jgi:hypothetical protein